MRLPSMTPNRSNGTEPTLPLTLLAAQRLKQLRITELPPKVRQKASVCLIDYLGALVSGLSAPWSTALLSYARTAAHGVAGSAQVIGLNLDVPVEIAAFTNAAIAHSMIRDDMHLSAGAHIGVMVIPACLALAQRDHWTPFQLLHAIVAGYEMAVLLGSAVRSSGTCNPHFRPSGIIGAFAVAGAGITGASSEVSLEQCVSALSLAANMAAGLNEWPWAGGMEINTQMGVASRSGVASLDLARAGMRSSETVLEGKDGLFAAYGCGANTTHVFRKWLGEKDLGAGILGANFKPFSGCNFIQTPLAVAVRLHAQIQGAIGHIDMLSVVTTTAARDYPGCNNLGPFDKVQQTKMSLQYGVAAALLFGKVDEGGYHQYSNKALIRLINKCVIETDMRYDLALRDGRQPCRIVVYLEDGTVFEDAMEDVPWLEAGSVKERFLQEAKAVFDEAVAMELLEECLQLGSATTCTRLFSLLAQTKTDGLGRDSQKSGAEAS